MVSLFIPPTPEESGGSQGDLREDDPRDEMVEMSPLLMPEEFGEPEKDGEDAESESRDLPETEPELAGAPATKPEMKEEGPVVLNEPDPVDQPETFPDSEGNMLPLEQFRLSMGLGRLIPAGMEDTYVTTLTHRGQGWLSQIRTMPVYADSRLARLTPPSSPPSYADRGVVPVAAMVTLTGRGKEMSGGCGGVIPGPNQRQFVETIQLNRNY